MKRETSIPNWGMVASIVAVAIASGCASSGMHKLPPRELVPLNAWKGRATGVRLFIEPFDQATRRSTDSTLVGVAKTGMFNATTPVYLSEPGSALIERTVSGAFQSAGAEIVKREEASFIVTGVLNDLWVEEYATGWSPEHAAARVKFDVILETPDAKIVWVQSAEGHAVSNMTFIDATDAVDPTLNEAVTNAVRQLFANQDLWGALRGSDAANGSDPSASDDVNL